MPTTSIKHIQQKTAAGLCAALLLRACYLSRVAAFLSPSVSLVHDSNAQSIGREYRCIAPSSSSCRHINSINLKNRCRSFAFFAGTKQENEPILLSESNDNDNDNDNDNGEQLVKVGSESYYEGFFSRSMNEEPSDRVTGDNLLGPTFKFVGGGVVIIVALFLGFMVSNGLI